MSRNKILFFIAILTIACSSLLNCAAVPIRFDVTSEGKASIPKGSLLEQLAGGLGFDSFVSFDISQSQEFKNNNAKKEHVVDAKLKTLELTIDSPDGQNFDFLEEIAFFIESPGIEKKQIASKKVPRGIRVFTCDLDGVDLAPYIKAEKMTITTSVKGKRPEKDTVIKAKLVIDVGASIF